jgi:hypothetical protein
MGIPIHPRWPPVPGPDCPTCSPDPWPSGATPNVVRVVFRGLANYDAWPAPPNGVPIHISNDSINPCYYSATLGYGVSTYLVEYDAASSVVILTRTAPILYTLFDKQNAPCSIGPFANGCVYPDFSPIGGTAVLLDFPLSIILTVADDYNFMADTNALYDIIDSATPTHKTVRLSRGNTQGSCLLQVDPAGI